MQTIRSISRVTIILAVVFTIVGFSPKLSPAGSITVTTTIDEYDDPGPGEGCSLREAITAANTDLPFGGCLAGSGTDTINLPAGTYTFARTGIDDTNINGDLDIYSSLTLTGGGMDMTFLDAAHIDRVIHILGAYTVNLNKLALQNGHPASGTGGGLQNDDGNVTLSGIRISGNQSGTGRVGGGIGNYGTMALEACLIDGNAAGNNTYESWAGDGGGISNGSDATMTIDHSIIRDNQAGSRSEASADTADIYAGHGGGIFNSGSLSIDHSLIWNNHAGDISGVHTSGSYCVIGGWGGGIGNLGVLTVMNSTIYANTSGSATAPAMYCSRGGNGGAYWGLYSTAELENATIYANTAQDGDTYPGIVGGMALVYASASIHNTILTGNETHNCDDIDGTLISDDYNILTGNSCPTSGTTAHNLASDPLLSALTNHWGPSLTLALLPGSPAIDAGDPASCPAADQRGFFRPLDGDAVPEALCDIGAFEFGHYFVFIPMLLR